MKEALRQAAPNELWAQEKALPRAFSSIRKRDGRIVRFDKAKITYAIYKAQLAVGQDNMNRAETLTEKVLDYLEEELVGAIPTVEGIQDIVERVLIEAGHAKVAKSYILYRDKRTRIRDAKAELMDIVADILVETSRENANVGNSPSAKMLQIASAASRHYYLHRLIPEDVAYAHIDGDIHIHDLEFYGKTLTCIQIPLYDLLSRGFSTGHGFIRPPKRPSSATALAAIILQSSQNDMHGGQSYGFFDRDMASFVEGYPEDDVYQAMEAFVYNLNSMHSRAGSQVPFSSVNLGCDLSEAGRMVTRCLLLAFEKGLGKGENPIFPNIIFRVKEGVNFNPGDPNYDLFRLAMRVASRRMNPTFSFMDASYNEPYGDEVAYMGCRTRVIANRRGPQVTTGRGNLSFTSVNLPRIAIKAQGDLDKFFTGLREVVRLAIRQLFHRYRIQCRLKVKDMPFLMGQHLYLDSENLGPDDTIESAIVHGTLSVGFLGLAEALKALTGHNHGENEEARRLGVEIVAFMRQLVDEASEIHDLNYTLLATPAEGLSGRFIAKDRKKFGVIEGVTDKEFYTNSFHVPVDCEIGMYEKIMIEGVYHKYTNAGHISYIELDSPPTHNIEAVEAIVRHMRSCDVGYGGINFPIDECRECSYSGVIESSCPKCGSSSIRRIRRITGYLSTVDRFNDAKRAELAARTPHRTTFPVN
ncbi:MAG TPA: anaerobic ribonucleoside-triphosphate reductase [Firmicutes bacterium]|jgi:anaerobic ribonucleoside-triphosphate reductase|nr:anaerobic ribonucleoside-triphosphate reductase [Bacillota bacterium]